MSLFKALNFWSFDLGHLMSKLAGQNETNEQESDSDDHSGTPLKDNSATFLACPGRFHSIGSHDVLVCANLNGLICIIQVPKEQQLMQAKEEKHNQHIRGSATKSKHATTELGTDTADNRQLLCAKDLNFPVVDIKCGHFISALKQSIAVISFNKLLVYQVKRRQVDLLSGDSLLVGETGLQSNEKLGSQLILDEQLFSHEIEEHHRLDLFAGEISFNMVIIDRQLSCRRSIKSAKRKGNHNGQRQSIGELDNEASKTVQQAHLPQRDNIIVQYTNQFLLTIVDHKKIVGHFRLLVSNGPPSNEAPIAPAKPMNINLQQLGEFVGPMPAAYLHETRYPSLVIALSDHKIYCVPLAKFIALAKQSVVKRVAKNLLLDNNRDSQLLENSPVSSDHLSQPTNNSSTTSISLESDSSWSLELACAPLQMTPIQRQCSTTNEPSATINTCSSSTCNQLLVMSRYNLDLFSSTGAHIWSQRFETPLICMCNYVLESGSLKNNPSSGSSSDRLMSLICVDCLSSDRANLLIMEDDRIVWSAQLNNKPAQLWRTNLQQMTGTLTSLSINGNSLNSCYLGTNPDDQSFACDEPEDFENEHSTNQQPIGESDIVKLEHLNEPLFLEEHHLSDDKNSSLNEMISNSDETCPQKRKLLVQVRLEASNQWPNVTIDTVISIRPEFRLSAALQNIKVVLEFDDIFKFDQTSEHPMSLLNEAALEVQLGSFWPDRRDAIRLTGKFSMRNATSAEAAEVLSSSNQQQHHQQQVNWMPKSLKVELQLRFLETRSNVVWFQNESFLLPLNLIARLTHIDYSTGQNQSLVDIQSNLSMYKRHQASGYATSGPLMGVPEDERDAEESSKSPYFLCDLLIKTQHELIDVIDELIESDLICRGLNSESPDYDREQPRNNSRKLSTLENISLLAQSLDCRLKYKSLPRIKSMVKETSIDDLDKRTIMISIAFKIPTLSEIMEGLNQDDNKAKFDLVWLHLCDLSATDSPLPEEMVKQHMKEWKIHNIGSPNEPLVINESDNDNFNCPIMISIECEYPVPVLFLAQHLIERLKRRSIKQSAELVQQVFLQSINEEMIDLIDINFKNLLSMKNFVAMNVHLHDCLYLALDDYDKNLERKFEKLKENLNKGYKKFQVATMRSLSLSKRLSNLPTNMQQQFNNLSLLIKQYQFNLNTTLSELEASQRLRTLYKKIPSASL